MDDFTTLTVDSIRNGLQAKSFSARELAQEALRVAESDNEESGVYLSLTPERALAGADRVDSELAAGTEVSPLAGVPLAVKDVIMTRGEKTTCASRTLEPILLT